ncbi:hypothetical protein TB2_026145 [Malus domestica]
MAKCDDDNGMNGANCKEGQEWWVNLDEAADPKLAVEDKLVLEAVEDDDIQFGDAAEGQGVGPEAVGLELASPSADVDQFGGGGVGPQRALGGGEEAKSEGEVGI